jgi:hypothetical protein
MSFDVWLVKNACTHCGAPVQSVYEFNITHNVNKIVDACFVAAGEPKGLRPEEHYSDWSWGRLEGWLAKDARVYIAAAYAAAVDPANANRFHAWEPENKWGTLANVQDVLREFHEACLKFPDAKIRVSG